MGDARPRFVLTLMNGDGELRERFIPTEGPSSVTQLSSKRFGPWHGAESQVEARKLLAHFHVTGLRIVLEPFVNNVSVEPPFSWAATEDKWSIPSSSLSDDTHHYVYIRPEDTVIFRDQKLQIRCSLENMPPSLEADDAVQVKSSDPRQPQEAAPNAGASEAETEDEDEVGGDASGRTPAETTPATSRLATTKEVKETPHDDGDAEDEVPFSTALEPEDDANADAPAHTSKLSSEIGVVGDADSPGVRAKQQRADRAKRSQETATPRLQSFPQSDFPSSPKIVQKYGKGSKRNTPDPRTQSSVSDPSESTKKFDDARLDQVPTTSEVDFPNGLAVEVAQRSLQQKRKVDNTESEDTSIKARKVSPAPPDFGEAESDSDDGDPSQISAGGRISSGRLPPVSRAPPSEHDEETDDEDEAGEDDKDDEIVAKPKKGTRSSPNVVIRPQRPSASKTAAGTPSSTATSSLPGKPPKVIISNVTGSYTPASALTKFLKSQGSTLINKVPTRKTNFLCMVKDDKKLLKTPKVLRSLALGKKIVTERWARESKAAGELLDPEDFIHAEVADTQDLDRRKLFTDKVVFFTNAAAREYGDEAFAEMKEIVSQIGASLVDKGNAGKGAQTTGKNQVIYIGTKDDADATTLIVDHGLVVYHKDIVKDAIVRGELDLDDEQFMLPAGKTKNASRR